MRQEIGKVGWTEVSSKDGGTMRCYVADGNICRAWATHKGGKGLIGSPRAIAVFAAVVAHPHVILCFGSQS